MKRYFVGRRRQVKEFKYVITDELGMHARPAGLLVKKTTGFQAAIRIKKDEKEVDAKKMFAIMGLGIKKGNEITVSADGADEDEAIAAIETFVKTNL